MRRVKTVIINRRKLMEAIDAYCKRNGVSIRTVTMAYGTSNKFEYNGKTTYKRKHPGSNRDLIELSEQTYGDICKAFLLTPSRYIVDDNEEEKPETPEPRPAGTAVTAYLRMINERLIEINKQQAEQTELLKRLVDVWEANGK